ncbi:hypothetical protein MNBD_ALPHA09-1529 [hydrothermal vent metagenome]|uniref:LysM domain-containing protein n=1 Tax=hydrothermal vent metagenome TaxID=652676 RepID=A0A3B0T8K3_9ZZZZ
MKNLLVALLGVSLVAISYAAYELELKQPAATPSAQSVAASGAAATRQQVGARTEKTAKPPKPENPPVQGSGIVAKVDDAEAQGSIAADTPAPSVSQGKNVTALAEKPPAAPAAVPAPAKEPETGPAESPSMAKTAMDTVASLPTADKEAEKAPQTATGKTETAGSTSPQAETQAPSVLAPLTKAVETVRKLVGGDGDKTAAVAAITPQDKAAEDLPPPAGTQTQESAPKGLVARAVDAVTELVAPKTPAKKTTPDKAKAADGTMAATATPPASPKGAPQGAGKETKIAATSPAPASPMSAPAKPVDGLVVPSFDVVRVERDGSAVIAGRAEPGAQIELRAGGKTLGTATASRRGEFVIIPDQPIPAGSSALALQAQSTDGRLTTSNQVVTVAVPKPAAPALVKVAPAPTPVPAKAPVAEQQKVAVTQIPVPEAKTATAVVPAAKPPSAEPKKPVQAEIKVAVAPAMAPKPVVPAAEPKKPVQGETKVAVAPAVMPKPAAPSAATPVPAPTPAPLASGVDTSGTKPGKADGLKNTQRAVVVPSIEAPSTKVATAEADNVPAAPAPETAKTKTAVSADPAKAAAPVVKADQTTAPAPVKTPAPALAETKVAIVPQPATRPATPKAQPAETKAEVKTPAPAVDKPKAAKPRIAAATPDTNAGTPPARAQMAPAQEETPQKTPAKPAEPLVVVSEPGSPSRVLQGGAAKPKTPITFETVDYDDEGQIILAGQVAPGADVRAYLGAAHLGDAKAGADGSWVLRTTRQIDPGTYQLRVDKIDVGGKVLARVTAPFERAAPEAVARVRASGEVIIQPGDNLWNISRALYGSGTQYTVIYDANRNQISKPDLIFPGQVFMTPGAKSISAVDANSG